MSELSVKELKAEMAALGLSTDGCVERSDLEAALLAARSKPSRAGRRAVGAMISEAISIGVPIYNGGDPRGCAEVYRECCEDILQLQGGLDLQMHQSVRKTLARLPHLPSDDQRAWKLRHTLDAVLQNSSSSAPAASASSSSSASARPHAGAPAATSSSSSTGAPSTPESPAATIKAPIVGLQADTVTAEADGVRAEVRDDGWEEELACSICLEFLWEPIKLGCGHHFCRCCILKATRLSPDGGQCPNCRATIDVDPDVAPADPDLQARVQAVVSEEDRQLRKEISDRDLEQLRRVSTHTLPVFAMSPGVRPGDPVSLNLFEPRYKTMIRRIMGSGGNQHFVFTARLPQSGDEGSLVLVQRTSEQINGNIGISGVALCSVTLDQVWIEQQAQGLYYCKTSSPQLDRALSVPFVFPEGEVDGGVPRGRRRERGAATGNTSVAAGGNNSTRADLPVFYMRGGSCRVGQRVMLNLFESRYRALAAIVMGTHRMFIFATSEPAAGSSGVIVRISSCQFQRDGSARIQGRGIEEVVLSRIRTDRGVGNLMHARVSISTLAAATALAAAGRDSSDDDDDGSAAPGMVVGHMGKKKKCVVM